FERLGAVPDAQRATQLLGGVGAGPKAATQPEIKTFMFTDMVKSTSLVDAIGDHAWQDVLRWHDQTLRTLMARHKGEEIDQAGPDDILVSHASLAGASLRVLTSEPKTLNLQGFTDPVAAVSVRWRP